MAESRHRLVTLILLVVVLTLLSACVATTIALAAAGNWEKHARGMTLALKIMWGIWALLAVATILTHLTMFGWRFRHGPRQWPSAIYQTIKEGVEPPTWFKSGKTSFTITVVFVSLLGASCVATVLLWIVGDWREDGEALGLTIKIIWAAWWVLAIATVLVRVALFARQRRKQKEQAAEAAAGKAAGTPDGDGEKDGASDRAGSRRVHPGNPDGGT